MRPGLRWFLILLLCMGVASSVSVAGQTRIEVRGCAIRGTDYSCDKHNFEQILGASKTISVEGPRSDPYSLKQLDKLVRSLGKAVGPERADLTFVLSRNEPGGIYYGPNDRRLATIRVYYGGSGGNRGKLVWVENYSGQPDTAWPITVDHLTNQFRADVKP